ncbi:MAG: sulfite exporter TauE/SafE family protein [Lentisphaerae bacterium]|nr:sulfite exporter TauE/SafE family protein [Lentisphaerota bacterium]
MTPLLFIVLCFFVSVVAGTFGSLLGLGGGIIVIPALTLGLGIDIRYAIGASIVAVIATSSGAAAVYLRRGMTNLRVAMALEVATTLGAVSGGYLAGHLHGRWLHLVFGVVMGYSGLMMLRRRETGTGGPRRAPWADFLRLHSSYFEPATDGEITYRVVRARVGLALMYLAGVISGLLGIGSGALKVPAMDLAMRLPIKVSSATSNFMMGVTAAASAGLYFARGDIQPFIAAPVAVGVVVGAALGARLIAHVNGQVLRRTFVVVLLVVAAQMVLKGIRG